MTQPTLNKLYSDADDQEIARFTIKADDVEKVTFKDILFDVNGNRTDIDADLTELLTDSDVRLLDANGDEVSAAITVDPAGTIKFDSMNHEIAKNTDAKFTVVADFGDITPYNTKTLQLANNVAHVRNSSSLEVVSGTLTTTNYTFGAQPLRAVMTAQEGGVDPVFKVVLNNKDTENNVNLDFISFKLQVTAG